MDSSAYSQEHFDDEHEAFEHQGESQFQYTIHKYTSPMMEFKGDQLSGRITFDPDTLLFTVEGIFHGLKNMPMKYWAANPINRIYSYPGSGLPFPNPEVAYENTPNQGEVALDNHGQFTIYLQIPSGYYLRQGKVLLKPHVHFSVPAHNQVFTVAIADDFPYRSLKNLPDRPNRTIGR